MESDVLCERCFYLADPKCPSIPYACAVEKYFLEGDPETQRWIKENLADKLRARGIKVE